MVTLKYFFQKLDTTTKREKMQENWVTDKALKTINFTPGGGERCIGEEHHQRAIWPGEQPAELRELCEPLKIWMNTLSITSI